MVQWLLFAFALAVIAVWANWDKIRPSGRNEKCRFRLRARAKAFSSPPKSRTARRKISSPCQRHTDVIRGGSAASEGEPLPSFPSDWT